MEIKNFLMYLNTQQTAQAYLYNCYKDIDDAEVKSYQNCNTFIYYLDHGLQFYENGKRADLLVQPVLYFYGMTHLIKAYLLTKRPDYPESTSMLAHGVTTRKRKKKQYSFIDDEVKIQKLGLFPYFSKHLYAVETSIFEKIRMEDLFSLVPEMSDFFALQNKEKMIVIGSADSNELEFPLYLLDNYHLTKEAFIKRVKILLPQVKQISSGKEMLHIELEFPMKLFKAPLSKHLNDDNIYFPLDRDHFLPFSDMMIHYLILFNLSMLCRYEAEWWGDLLVSRADTDYSFIRQFLQVTALKIPRTIGEEMMLML